MTERLLRAALALTLMVFLATAAACGGGSGGGDNNGGGGDGGGNGGGPVTTAAAIGCALTSSDLTEVISTYREHEGDTEQQIATAIFEAVGALKEDRDCQDMVDTLAADPQSTLRFTLTDSASQQLTTTTMATLMATTGGSAAHARGCMLWLLRSKALGESLERLCDAGKLPQLQ